MVDDNSSVSLVARKLGQYAPLTENETELLARLEKGHRTFPRNSEIVSNGNPLDNLYAVRAGWLMSYTILPDGRRQVLQLHFPGDIISLCDLPFGHTTHDVKTLTECDLSVFTPDSLYAIFGQSPRLTALLFGTLMMDHAGFMDRVRVLGRMNARERIVHFLLSTLHGLRMSNSAISHKFDFPLTQFDLADAVGLTNVSVSNALSALQEQGILQRSSGQIHILNESLMREMASFTERRIKTDLSWLPKTAR